VRLPDPPLVLVARVGSLDRVGAGLHLEDQVEQLLQRASAMCVVKIRLVLRCIEPQTVLREYLTVSRRCWQCSPPGGAGAMAASESGRT
jgi:hypothetical protein